VATLPAGTFFYVRAAPDVGARAVGRVLPNDHVAVLGAVPGTAVAGDPIWYAVRLAGGRRGYVSSSAIDELRSFTVPWIGVATNDGEDSVTSLQAFDDAEATTPYAGYALGSTLTVLGAVHGAALEATTDLWYRVRTAAPHPVYVYAAYLKYLRAGRGALPLPLLSARSVLVKDLDDGHVLYAREQDVPRAPASLVKMMTALLAVQRLSLDTVLTVPAGAPSVGLEVGGTAMGLAGGERMTVRDLLYGMLLPSGNDAAYTLAQAMGGSQAGFAQLMNVRARALGLRHTHFMQGYGLDQAGQYSTADDLAALAAAVLRVPALAAIVRTTSYTIPATSLHGAFSLHDTNLLLGTYPGVYGVKTGTTPEAGQCLVTALHTSRGHHILAVVLGSDDRYADARHLLDYASALEG
jgi:D-alanyl-D-alanine carboxypeptidase